MPFGSIVTGLGIISSDADCYVQVPEHCKDYQANLVMQARNILRKQWFFRQVFAITTAKVPIVKMYHVPTRRMCDVNFKSPSGVRNSQLIACLLRLDERALTLAVFIKYWSKVHCLTGTNLVPNYALVIMIIFYMQHKNILPSVLLLQQISNENMIVDDWNTAFGENYLHNTVNNQSLYELIGDFFTFYSSYEFKKYIISPFTGSSIPRKLFEKLEDIPDEFDLYKLYKGMKHKEGFQPICLDKPMCVQDVFDHSRNCTAAVFLRLATRLMQHFKLAAQIYAESDAKDFLLQVLTKKPIISKDMKNLSVSTDNDRRPIKRKIYHSPNSIPSQKKKNAPSSAAGPPNNSNPAINVQATQRPKKLKVAALYNEYRKRN